MFVQTFQVAPPNIHCTLRSWEWACRQKIEATKVMAADRIQCEEQIHSQDEGMTYNEHV